MDKDQLPSTREPHQEAPRPQQTLNLSYVDLGTMWVQERLSRAASSVTSPEQDLVGQLWKEMSHMAA